MGFQFDLESLLAGPIELHPDNFTPLTRTPWAGQEIGRSYKVDIASPQLKHGIGESWEVSCDPAFYSYIMIKGQRTELTLQKLVESFPAEVLSPKLAAKGIRTIEILVKLLNAAEPLSLQVHPTDLDRDLKPGECGKPESWLILKAEPGSGLYLGFKSPVTTDELRKILLDGDRGKELLYFVPVKENDYFEIAPGVPHAIGAGVTLLEPQRIMSGKSGKTYRLWDFGRKYDEKGRLDPLNGKPRELHIDEGLKLVDPMRQVGESFVSTTRRKAKISTDHNGVEHISFPKNEFYQVHRFKMNEGAKFDLKIRDGYGALIMLSGRVRSYNSREMFLSKGRSYLIPHKSALLTIEAKDKSDFCLIIPAGSGLI